MKTFQLFLMTILIVSGCNSVLYENIQQNFTEPFGGRETNRYQIRNVSIEGVGNQYKGQTGSSVSISMEINHNCIDCGGAINQIIAGIGGEAKAQVCVWQGMQSSGGWEIVKFELQLPQKSGIYYLRSRYAQDYTCDRAMGWWKVDRPQGPTENIGVFDLK